MEISAKSPLFGKWAALGLSIMGNVFPIPDLSMSTEAALFTAHDGHRTKYIAVPERAIRHLVGQPSPWRLCDGEIPSMPSALTDRVLSWVNPQLRRIAVAPAAELGLLASNTDSFASVFGVDGLEGDRPGCVGRVVLDAPQLERLPDCWRPQFLKALDH